MQRSPTLFGTPETVLDGVSNQLRPAYDVESLLAFVEESVDSP